MIAASALFLPSLVISYVDRQKGLIRLFTPISFIGSAVAAYAAGTYMSMDVVEHTTLYGVSRIIGESPVASTAGFISSGFVAVFIIFWILVVRGDFKASAMQKLTATLYILGGIPALIGSIVAQLEWAM